MRKKTMSFIFMRYNHQDMFPYFKKYKTNECNSQKPKTCAIAPPAGKQKKVLFLKKYKFIYFNWRLITLQYCIGFAVHQHESATGVHVFPILDPLPSSSHPSGSSQCTSPEHPVSCIEPGLAICFIYDIVHVSMPFSQIIPPSPSPTESKTVLYICVSFAVSHTGLSLPSL